jgi:hypothetical protein
MRRVAHIYGESMQHYENVTVGSKPVRVALPIPSVKSRVELKAAMIWIPQATRLPLQTDRPTYFAGLRKTTTSRTQIATCFHSPLWI